MHRVIGLSRTHPSYANVFGAAPIFKASGPANEFVLTVQRLDKTFLARNSRRRQQISVNGPVGTPIGGFAEVSDDFLGGGDTVRIVGPV